MRCPNCQTINPPGAKFCLECGNRFVVCPNCGTVNPPAAKFCIECGIRITPRGESTVPLPSPTPSESVLAPSEERRVVTIMFADITGSTPLADKLDPEDMRAILTGYFNLMTEQIRRHGGTVEKYIGDAVMAVFGAPVAHEDDPDRAIRAALDMQRALNNFNEQRLAQDPEATRLQMRIGINTGEVAAPGNAQHKRRDFLITGDAVNVAARLQQVAIPDTILVGERTYYITKDVFDFRPLAPLHLKGKPEALHTWAVQGLSSSGSAITQHPRGIEGVQAPLVGRMLELALMHATYARVQAEQHPHLITLLGAPGIGKSRLVREFITREQETATCTSCDDTLAYPLVLVGRCPPYGEGITYRPLVHILRSLLQIQEGESVEKLRKRFTEFVREILEKAKHTEDPSEIAEAIIRSIGRGPGNNPDIRASVERREWERQGSALGKNLEQSGPRGTLLRAWRIFLEALAQRQPLILVIDDLQWADEALLDLLEYLMDRITDVPILFLCPARSDFLERRRDWGGGRRNFTTIALESLSAEESGELVTALLNTTDLPEVLCHTILSRAEGNPFFVEEILRMLIDQGVLTYKEGCWHIGMQNEELLSELASPAGAPEDTLLDLHYVLPLPRIPDTIQGVLAARVDLLNPTEKRVLQHAAIIGRTFWLAALFELAGDLKSAVLLETLDSLIQHDFIVETEKQGLSPFEYDRVFSFKHILIRNVVYNNIPRMRRSQEHTQLALRIEEQAGDNTKDFVELLAYHYQQALVNRSPSLLPTTVASGDSPTSPVRLTRSELRSRTITYLTLAGDHALQSYYTIRAIQAYNEALELLVASEADSLTLARMHEKLGDAYYQRMDIDKALQEYRRALELETAVEKEERNTERLRLYDRLAELSTRWLMWKDTIDVQEVRYYIDAGLKLLEGHPASGQYAAFLTYQAMWYIRQVNMVDRQKRAELAQKALHSEQEALRIAEELNDTCSLWLTLDALSFIYSHQQKYLDAHKAQHYRLTLADRMQSREELHDLYQSLGWVHERVSDYSTAVKWFGQAWAIAQTMESPPLLLHSMIGRMSVWYALGRWSEAYETGENILQLIEQYQQNEAWQLYTLVILAVIAYQTGNQEEGDRYLRQYKRLTATYGPNSELIAHEPRIYLVREEWTLAIAGYKAALQTSEPFPTPEVLTHLAELMVITGENVEEQQSLCERAVTIAEQSGNRKSFANALRARGRMHLEQQHWSEAEQDLQKSLQQCEVLNIPWEKGQALYCLGLYYHRHADILNQNNPADRQADLGRAHRHFEHALGFFESLNAVHDAERVRLALKQDTKAPV